MRHKVYLPHFPFQSVTSYYKNRIPKEIKIMGTFSRIFGLGDKDLQKQADVLLLKLGKALQSASAKLHICADDWLEGKMKHLDELQAEIISLERKADTIKDELFEKIFSKGAYLPQQTQDRHQLVIHMDGVIDAAEEAVRMMLIGRKYKPPVEIHQIANKGWICTDLLQDAIKYLFTDFEKSVDYTLKIDKEREDARDLQFQLLERLFNGGEYSPLEVTLFRAISDRILQVAIRSEETGDFIRALAVRHS
jgi:predicted phosphate transport protein (TIGR00153 family)